MATVTTATTLYRNAEQPVSCNPHATDWVWPGVALTASTARFKANFAGQKLLWARWLITWTPGGTETAPTAIRLVYADDGPSNITEIARFEVGGRMTPVVHAVTVTDQLRGLLAAGVSKHLGHQIKGNGSAAPKIYLSEVEMAWDVSA